MAHVVALSAKVRGLTEHIIRQTEINVVPPEKKVINWVIVREIEGCNLQLAPSSDEVRASFAVNIT